MKIFVAEDNPADVYLLREALGVAGDPHMELMVVQDGEEALEFVAKRGKFRTVAKPDLIVLDLNLPKSDGNEVLKYIRESSEFADVPVVIFTSSDSPRDRAAADRLGADGYITKPSDLDAFLSLGDRLREFAGRHHRFSSGA